MISEIVKKTPDDTLPLEGDVIENIEDWFNKAVPVASERDIANQISVHFGEIAKMLELIIQAGISAEAKEKLTFGCDVMQYLSRQLAASEEFDLDLEQLEREKVLETLSRQVVSSTGIATLSGMAFLDALKAVAVSNQSKFGSDGKPVFSDEMKLIPSTDYFRPDLAAYV